MTGYTFPQLIDFTRTSAATFVNSSGNIASTPQSRNLLTFTQEFDNAAWVKASATVTANTTLAPNATNTADSLISTVGTGEQRVYRESLIPSTAGITYTFSVYAKANGANWLVVRDDWRGFADTSFDLVNGVVGTVASGRTAIITAAGNGWYRCSVTATVNASFVSGSVSLCLADADNGRASFSGNGTKAMFLWGAQLEQASAATDYTRNFGGLFPPRFDYDPVSLAPRGLLIEEQRTNLLLRSEEFDNASWVKNNATVTANATTSPDGTVDADKLVENTANSTHNTTQGFSSTNGVSYTFTVYAKAAERSWIALQFNGSVFADAIARTAYVNVSTGAVGTLIGSSTVSVTSVGNGWYRIAMTVAATATSTGAAVFAYLANADNSAIYTGDGTSGLFLYGAQVEAGAFATSYIPTVASQVTRSADSALIQAPNFASWYNQASGTFVVEAVATAFPTGTSNNAIVTVSDGTNSNRQSLYSFNNVAYGATVNGNVVQANPTSGSGLTAGNVYKLAYAYATNDFAFSTNGAAVGTDTSGTVPTVNQMQLGRQITYDQLNGWIRSVRFYPTRLTNAQLQALTA